MVMEMQRSPRQSPASPCEGNLSLDKEEHSRPCVDVYQTFDMRVAIRVLSEEGKERDS